MTSTPPPTSSPSCSLSRPYPTSPRSDSCMGGTVSFFAATLAPSVPPPAFYGGGVTTGRSDSRPWWNSPPTSGVRGSVSSDLDQSIRSTRSRRCERRRTRHRSRPRSCDTPRPARFSTATRDPIRSTSRRDRRPSRALASSPSTSATNSQLRGTSFRRRPCRCVVLPVARGPVRQ